MMDTGLPWPWRKLPLQLNLISGARWAAAARGHPHRQRPASINLKALECGPARQFTGHRVRLGNRPGLRHPYSTRASAGTLKPERLRPAQISSRLGGPEVDAVWGIPPTAVAIIEQRRLARAPWRLLHHRGLALCGCFTSS